MWTVTDLQQQGAKQYGDRVDLGWKPTSMRIQAYAAALACWECLIWQTISLLYIRLRPSHLLGV